MNSENNLAGSRESSLGDLTERAQHQMSETLERGQEKLEALQGLIEEKTRACWDRTDAYVQENPWRAVGWAAGIGVVIGLLCRRR